MEENKADVSFCYTYSAKEQDEIEKIRQKYLPEEEGGISRIRKLDASVTKKATIVSLILGIVGTLVMGSGMSIIMTELGAMLGLTGITGMVVGVSIGLIGLILVALAYPVYGIVLKKERKKVAPEILRLTETLMK